MISPQTRLIALAITAAIASSGVIGFVGHASAEPFRLDAPAYAQAETQKNSSRDSYFKQNEGWFEEWGAKIDDFAAKTADKGSDAKAAAKRQLDEAWQETKASWTKLKSTSQESWDDAKSAYEKNRQKLLRAWDDAQD